MHARFLAEEETRQSINVNFSNLASFEGGVCVKAMAGSLKTSLPPEADVASFIPMKIPRKHQFCNARGQLPEVHVSLCDYIQSDNCADLRCLNPDDGKATSGMPRINPGRFSVPNSGEVEKMAFLESEPRLQ